MFVMKTISYWDDLMTAPKPWTVEFLLIDVYSGYVILTNT